MFDVVIIGGGPCGATAAEDLGKLGHKVALLDRPGRIKPCGGAVPPILIRDFEIPDHLLKAKIVTARMVSPTNRSEDIPIENGFVGMVDREEFDEFLRKRAESAGVTRFSGTFDKITRQDGETIVEFLNHKNENKEKIRAKIIIGADGARSKVARSEIPGADQIPYVIAYHEIIKAPEGFSGYLSLIHI